MRGLTGVPGQESTGGQRQDAQSILARLAGGRSGVDEERSIRERAALVHQLGAALVVSGRAAGAAAVTSGRWLADVVMDTAPRIPARDLQTLRSHHPGLDTEQLADALVITAARATAAVGVACGALSAVEWAAPVTLVALPLELAAEVVAVAAIEIKLVAELHETYGVPVRGLPTQRGAAYALSWATRRGVNPLEPATVSAAIGVVARRRVQRRLLARLGRSLGAMAPLMAGAAYAGYTNRKQTLLLADTLRGDLRRRPLVTGLTGNAVSKLLEPGARRLAAGSGRRVRRRRPPQP